MADRSSAELFATIFEMLADPDNVPLSDGQRLAAKLWPYTENYDFDPRQMGCDKALKRLGLARKGVDPDYPEDGKVWLYGPEDES